jgi:enoyl-CoA hydratase
MFVSQVQDQIAVVTLNRPPVNALSREWADAFNATLDELEKRNDWRVLRIRSALRLFSAGGDIKQFASRLGDERAGDQLAEEAKIYQKLFDRIGKLPQISIAEIAGVAAGGGFELALACDLRLAARSARLGLPEVGLGLLPSAGGIQRVTRLCGMGKATRFVGMAELLQADEAHAFGLVEWVFDDQKFEESAGAVAKALASQPREALQAAKSCIAAALDPARDGFAEEAEAPRRLMKAAETRARIEEFVAKKAKAK